MSSGAALFFRALVSLRMCCWRLWGFQLSGREASVRFSLHRHTTEEEIAETLELVSAQVARLRELSAVAVR